jgi:hypothetical protein
MRTKCCGGMLLIGVLLASSARAQIASPAGDLARPRRLLGDQAPAPAEPSRALDVRHILDTWTNALSATPRLRAADTTLGVALLALGARSRQPMASAVFVGMHALQLGLGRNVPRALRAFDVQPDVSRERIAVTIRRNWGGAR